MSGRQKSRFVRGERKYKNQKSEEVQSLSGLESEDRCCSPGEELLFSVLGARRGKE